MIASFAFSSCLRSHFVTSLLARLRNHKATDDGNVDVLQIFQKNFYIQSLESRYKVVVLPVQKLLNDITLVFSMFGIVDSVEFILSEFIMS